MMLFRYALAHIYKLLMIISLFSLSGTRQGQCPRLNPTPGCGGNITGCDADERCSLGSRCCLQSDCTRKCVEVEIRPPASES